LMASCNDRGITPGTSFSGTDPENEPPWGVPGTAAPGELEPGAVGVCARGFGDQNNKTPVSRNVYPNLLLILKAASFVQSFGRRGGNILFLLDIPNNGYLLQERLSAVRALDALRARGDISNFDFSHKFKAVTMTSRTISKPSEAPYHESLDSA
jgi:hypothetical protein